MSRVTPSAFGFFKASGTSPFQGEDHQGAPARTGPFQGEGPITTFDLVKTFAVLIMVIDHLGFYFFTPPLGAGAGDPALWWRVVGRWGLPVWFFLIGYAGTRPIPKSMIAGAVILEMANIVTGMFIFPLNALASMIFIRATIDRLTQAMVAKPENLMSGVLILSLLFAPTNELFEYGSIGFLLAAMGRVTRLRRDQQDLGVLAPPRAYSLFMAMGGVSLLMSQSLTFHFGGVQTGVAWMGMAGVLAALALIRPTIYPFLDNKLPFDLKVIFKVCGRYTLEIYVIHLVVFKLIATIFGLGYPIYGWFDWDWTIVDAFQHIPPR